MAAYDPYNNDRYYDPRFNTQENVNPIRSIASFAKNMAGYAILQTAASAAISVAGKGAAKGIRSIANSRAPKSLFAKRMSKIKSPGMMDVIKSTQPGRAAYSVGLKAARPYQQAYKARARGLKQMKGVDRLAANKARMTSIFKNRETFVGTMGSLIGRHAIKGSAVSYMFDAATGQLDHMGIQNKPIWDVPGHVMNYANYMKKNAATFTAFGAMGGVFESAKGAVGVGLRNVFDKNKAIKDKVLGGLSQLGRARYGRGTDKDFFKKSVLDFQSAHEKNFFEKSINNVKGAVGATYQAVIENGRTYMTEATRHAKHATSQKNAAGGSKTTGGHELVKSIIDDTKEIWRAKREQARMGPTKGVSDIPGFGLLDTISDVGRSSTKTGMPSNYSADRRSGQHFLDAVSEFNDQIKPKGFIASVLRLKSTKVGDVVNTKYISRTAERTASYFPNGDTSQLKDAISKAHLGKNLFKSGKFQMDLSFMDPMHQISRVMNKLGGINFNLPISIPPIGRNISLGDITGLNTILSQKVHATPFRKSTTGLGLIVDSNEIAESKFSAKSYRPKTLQQLAADSLGEQSVSSNDIGISFIAGKFYAHDGTNVTPLSSRHSVLKQSNPAIFGAAGEAKTAPLRRWMYHNAKNDESFIKLDRLKKEADRGKTSPLNWFQKKFDWETPQSVPAAISRIKKALMPGRVNKGNGKRLDHTEELYAQAVEGILGQDIRFDKLHEYVPYLEEMLKHSDQEVAHLLKRKSVFNEIAAKSQARHLSKNDSQIMLSNQKFIDRLRQDQMEGKIEPGGEFAKLFNNPNLKSIYNTAMSYPNRAKDHILFQRNGRLSQLSSMDYLKVNYVSEAVGASWDGQGPHPFIDAANNLLDRGLISSRQANALRTRGTIGTLFRDGRLSSEPTTYDNSTKNMIRGVVNKFKGAENNQLENLIDYISDTDMRPARSKFSSFKLIHGNTFDAFKRMSYQQSIDDKSPFFATTIDPNSKMRTAGYVSANVLDLASERFTNMIGDLTGLKRDPLRYGNGFIGAAKFVTTRAAQVAAAVTAYKAADAFIAGNPMMDSTSFDDGVTGFVADNIAKVHMLSSRVMNVTGVAGVGRHLEGLMPGFTSSAPGAIIGGALNWKAGPMGVVGNAIKGAFANRMLAPYMPDMTKTYDQLKSEYSGESEVPIIEGRGWLLGTTPWQGRRVVGWQPNWYVRTKSRWQASDSLYGSELRRFLHEPIFPIGMSIGDVIDPYYMERKHYFSRPYPETGDFGEEVPLGLGPLISGTVGKLIKPKKLMHREFLHGSDIVGDKEVSALAPPSVKESLGMMRTGTFNPRSGSGKASFMGTHVYAGTKMYGQQMADRALDDFESALGLAGFGANTLREGLAPRNTVMPTLETAGRMASQSRSYYDMNLGGLGIYSEVIRRFIQKPDWRKYGINPIPNLLPNWLPERFTKGDPFSKIMKGELRLPGPAYEKTHANIQQSMPGRASMIGAPAEHSVKYFTGLMSPLLKEEYDILETGTASHEAIQSWLQAEGLLIQAEALVYDAQNDISGHVDAIIADGQGGRGRRALEIKTISDAGLKKLDGPKYQHVGQLNFYLNQLNMKKGNILYVSRDNPSDFKMFEVNYNRDRYSRDIENLNKSRSIAAQMLAKNQTGDGYGYSYSWLDRMKILADVAPTSKEYKEAKYIVERQIKSGMLTDEDIVKYKTAQKHRKATIRKYELYPTRFRGQIMSPDTEANIQSTNENIKAAAEYSLPERIVGAAWESFTNLNTPLVNKFFAFKDPIEHYKQFQVYGKEYTPWTDPYGSFIQPQLRSMVGQEDFLGGSVNWALGPAYALGGRVGAVLGAVGGGLYGAAHGFMRRSTGTSNMPNDIAKRREINDYFDQLKYYKNTRMSYLTEGAIKDQFTNQSRATLTSILNNGGTYTDFFRSVDYTEKPYIESFLNESDPGKREEIARFLPERLGKAMRSHWHNTDQSGNTSNFVKNTSRDNAAGRKTMPYTMQQLDPSVMLEDIKLKTINREGLNAHDFGLGWQDQMIRVQNSMDDIQAASMEAQPERISRVSVGAVKSAVLATLNRAGINGRVRIFVNNHADNDNNVTLTIQRDRLQSLRNVVSNRERFL